MATDAPGRGEATRSGAASRPGREGRRRPSAIEVDGVGPQPGPRRRLDGGVALAGDNVCSRHHQLGAADPARPGDPEPAGGPDHARMDDAACRTPGCESTPVRRLHRRIGPDDGRERSTWSSALITAAGGQGRSAAGERAKTARRDGGRLAHGKWSATAPTTQTTTNPGHCIEDEPARPRSRAARRRPGRRGRAPRRPSPSSRAGRRRSPRRRARRGA